MFSDALLTSTINCATSILAGLVVFSTLGHMAKVSNKTVEQVIEEKGHRHNDFNLLLNIDRIFLGSELVFIVYPHTIALMRWSTLWAILFFLMLITLGIDSTVRNRTIGYRHDHCSTNDDDHLVWWSRIDYNWSMR
jgi:SNF family Na+-dependent transporter